MTDHHRMPVARILDRDERGSMMIAPVATACLSAPRLRSLYAPDAVPSLAPDRQAAFWTARALVMRGMRILGRPPAPVPPGHGKPPVWPADITGSISYAAGQVAVWLMRDADRDLGLDIRAIADPPALLSAAEQELLADLPGLARMTSDERLAAAVSAKHALAKALWPRAGARVPPCGMVLAPSQQSGITLTLRDDVGAGLMRGSSFRAELRVYPGLVLTRISVPRAARWAQPPQLRGSKWAPADG